MPGEFDFIEWVRARQKPSDFVPVPAGDDLAVLKWDAKDLLLVGTDQVLDGVHFNSSVHSPHDIGRKAMNRNLSDCAAMACLPAAAVATVALPKTRGMEYAKELYLGMKEAADVFNCAIVGGDTGSWDGPLALTVTVLGRTDGIEPVRRNGARPGDGIYVSAPLGGTILSKHLHFRPRIELARALARSGDAAAMIDLSDGLSRDLAHICRESGVGAVIEAERVPIGDDAVILGLKDGRAPLEHALHDGEDYELLFTCRGTPSLGIYIGRIISGWGVELETKDGRRTPLEPKGWEHTL
ncbi:MAG: thiamine-phosphate kinase [Tepidisphaeraceae bacterium]